LGACCALVGTAAAQERAWDLSVGTGVSVMPQYSGASTARPRLRVWVDAEYRTAAFGSFEINSGSLTIDPELRWNLLDTRDVGFGPLVGYRFGRDDTNPSLTSANDGSSRLQGLPTVGGAVDAGVQGHLAVLGIPLFAQVRSSLTAAQGLLIEVGAYLPLPASGPFTLTILPTVTWADAKQMRAFYGVGEEASMASGFAPYDPGAGWEDAAIELAGEWRVSEPLRIVASFAYQRLLGNAAGSPLVQSKNQLSVLAGLAWSF
jgi:outer membrane scaffolding protein for murein synthesis (MipA/OmpV family)